jgi:hypothetical protein
MKKAGATSIDLYNKKKTRTGLTNNIKLKSKKENFYISYGKFKSNLLIDILENLTDINYFIKNYVIFDTIVNKKFKGGAVLNDNGKLFLRILDIFDSKHDFEKPDKNLKKIDNFLELFLFNNTKNINMLFQELPSSDINIIHRLENLLFKQKTEDELLLYGIDNLLGFGDNNLTDKINSAKLSFLDLNELNNYNKKGNSLSINNATPIIINQIEYDKKLFEEIKNNLDLDETEIDKKKNNYIIDTSIGIIYNRSMVTWNKIINQINRLSSEITCLETKWDPHINKPINVDTYSIDELKTITDKIFNTSGIYESAFKRLTQKYFGLTYTTINGTYLPFLYFKEIEKYILLKTKIQTKNNEKFDISYDIYYHVDDNKYGIVWDYSGIPISAIKEKINEVMDDKFPDVKIVKSVKDSKYNIILKFIINEYLVYFLSKKTDKYSIIEILLDFKKSGDWGQALFCHYSNILNSERSPSHQHYNLNTSFITVDKLAALHSLLRLNIKTLFSVNSKKFLNIQNNANILAFYNPDLNITYKYLKNLINSIFSDYDGDIISSVVWNSNNLIDLNNLIHNLNVIPLINNKVNLVKNFIKTNYNKDIINISSKRNLFFNLIDKHFRDIEGITDINQIFSYLFEISNYIEMYNFTFINIEGRSDTVLGYYIQKMNTNISSFLSSSLFEKFFEININTIDNIITNNGNTIDILEYTKTRLEDIARENTTSTDIKHKILINDNSMLYRMINYIENENYEDISEYIHNIINRDYKIIYEIDNNSIINDDFNKILITILFELKKIDFLQKINIIDINITKIIAKIKKDLTELKKDIKNLIDKKSKYINSKGFDDTRLIYNEIRNYRHEDFDPVIDYIFDIDENKLNIDKKTKIQSKIKEYREKDDGVNTLKNLTSALLMELSNNVLFDKKFNIQYLFIKKIINSLLENISNSNNIVIKKCIDIFNISDDEKNIKKFLTDYYDAKFINTFKDNLKNIRNVLDVYIKKIFNYIEGLFNLEIDELLRSVASDNNKYQDREKKIDRKSPTTKAEIKKILGRKKDYKNIDIIMSEYKEDYNNFIKKLEDITKIFSE